MGIGDQFIIRDETIATFSYLGFLRSAADRFKIIGGETQIIGGDIAKNMLQDEPEFARLSARRRTRRCHFDCRPPRRRVEGATAGGVLNDFKREKQVIGSQRFPIAPAKVFFKIIVRTRSSDFLYSSAKVRVSANNKVVRSCLHYPLTNTGLIRVAWPIMPLTCSPRKRGPFCR